MSLHYKIEDPRFENYYNYYGTDGCRAVSYKDKPLREGISDKLLQNPLLLSISSVFNEGSRYTLKEIKEKLVDIYQKLGITRAPKATDIEEYYEIKRIRFSKINNEGKRDSGYELLKIKS